jgi:hypothetical protein
VLLLRRKPGAQAPGFLLSLSIGAAKAPATMKSAYPSAPTCFKAVSTWGPAVMSMKDFRLPLAVGVSAFMAIYVFLSAIGGAGQGPALVFLFSVLGASAVGFGVLLTDWK